MKLSLLLFNFTQHAETPSVAARHNRGIFIAGLGIGQIVSWGSLYYSFPLIAGPMGRALVGLIKGDCQLTSHLLLSVVSTQYS